MKKLRKKDRIFENIEITGVADKGKAVGRHNGEVVFVEGCVPGDIVDVRTGRKRKGVWNGRVERYVEKSKDRVTPVCEHFGVCGGCKWQHLDYKAQLHHKQVTVENALNRIGKVEVKEMFPILGALETEFYRNKMEFSFSNKRWLTEEEVEKETTYDNRNALGFHRPRAFDKVVDINKCHLQPDPSNEIRNAVRAFALKHDYTFFDIRQQKGLLRQLFIRTASTGEVMIIISFFYEDKEKRTALLDMLKDTFPQITSLQYVINAKKNDTITDQDIKVYNGRGFIYEKLRHVRFKVGPKSFFQTNTKQAERLYDVVVDFAELQGTENVYDLYTGLGSIALYVAKDAKHVVGIEEVAAAIEDAKENAKLNEIENTTFYAGDVKDILTKEFAVKHGKPDLVITDPPRAGMHADVVQMFLDLESPRIVYVSCNPSTQARDLNLLSEKYEVLKSKAVDMFPHTHHIENVVLLKLKK